MNKSSQDGKNQTPVNRPENVEILRKWPWFIEKAFTKQASQDDRDCKGFRTGYSCRSVKKSFLLLNLNSFVRWQLKLKHA